MKTIGNMSCNETYSDLFRNIFIINELPVPKLTTINDCGGMLGNGRVSYLKYRHLVFVERLQIETAFKYR